MNREEEAALRARLAEIDAEMEAEEAEIELYNSYQLSIKNIINGAYGAFANVGFACSCNEIANAITSMGRKITNHVAKADDEYWKGSWHLDTALHEKLGVTNVQRIPKKAEVWVYSDTDSVEGGSEVAVELCGERKSLRIEELWARGEAGGVEVTDRGHEMVSLSGLMAAVPFGDSVRYVPVKRVVRHRVHKEAWRLRSEDGAQVRMTADHSAIVVRDGERVVVKPRDVVRGDSLQRII